MILDTIVARKKEEVALLKKRGIAPPLHEPPPKRDFLQAMKRDGLSVIAEAKKASPSKGVIRPDFDPVAIARSYEQHLAQAISVLTDKDFFQGDLRYLDQVRQAVALPVLRKDFLIHPLQIEEAKLHGADAILLICAILEPAQLKEYLHMARDLELDVLVEVHDEYEMEMALAAGSPLVGINNRNLQTFEVDLSTTFRVMAPALGAIPVISESGIRCREDVARLQKGGVSGILIGEAFMRASDPGQMLRALTAP